MTKNTTTPSSSSSAVDSAKRSRGTSKFVLIGTVALTAVTIWVQLSFPHLETRTMTMDVVSGESALHLSPVTHLSDTSTITIVTSDTTTLSKGTSTTENADDPVSSAASSEECHPFFPDSIKTHLFYPKRFFEDGPGKPFQEHSHERPIGHPHYIVLYKNEKDPYSKSICNGTAVYFHLHKCGGSTMKQSRFRRFPGREKYFSAASKESVGDDYLNETSKRWDLVYQSQQQTDEQSSSLSSSSSSSPTNSSTSPNSRGYVTAFTFIRDPATRFISSLGQVLRPNNMNGLGNCPHVSNTSHELVDCVLSKIETKKKFLDLHFIPQSYELYHGFMGYDIGIHLVDLQNDFTKVVGPVLGGPDENSMIRAQSNTGTLALDKFLLTSDLATTFRDRICTLYKADVLMLQESGLTSTICPFVES